MDITQTLQLVGLTENESSVYLATLKLGEAHAVEIAKMAKFSRTYCYDVLRSLAEKGLVSYIDKENLRRFSAVSPKRIQKLFESRLTYFREIIPELETMYLQSPLRPRVRYFEGREGLRAIHEEIINEAQEISFFGSATEWIENFSDWKKFAESIVKNKIKIRDLVKKIPQTLEYQTYYQPPKQEMRFIKPDWEFKADVAIWQNKVAFFSYTDNEMHGVVIESTPIATTMATTFEILWQLADKS